VGDLKGLGFGEGGCGVFRTGVGMYFSEKIILGLGAL